MPFPCSNCHAHNYDDASFCDACGTPFRQVLLSESFNPLPPPMTYAPVSPQAALPSAPPYYHNAPLAPYDPPANPPGVLQTLGLHPLTAVTVFAVDCMLFLPDLGGVTWVISILVSFVLGFGVFLVQKNMYKDDDGTALAKAVMLALLTAIPTPLPGFLTAPSGFLGLIKVIRGK